MRCPNLRSDFVNVLTREPIRSGIHYFEFVMHKIGDEQFPEEKKGGTADGGRGVGVSSIVGAQVHTYTVYKM